MPCQSCPTAQTLPRPQSGVLVIVCRCVRSRLMFRGCLHKPTILLKSSSSFILSLLLFKNWIFLDFSSPLWLLFGLTEECQQVGDSQGHPVEPEHTQCDTFPQFRGTDPSSALEFSHHSAPSVGVCTSHSSQCCHQSLRGTCLNERT